ncbi:PIN domain-containing protein [Cellulomonas sp. SLBN-39]|nr:PIN domain-containing protein [Cellulomonas sp. SLBN-39]
MTRLRRVFIDTSELFPFTIMDVLLTLSEDLLYTWVWTDEVLDEWERVIVREGHRSAESAASVGAAVRRHFGRYRIDPTLYRNKVTSALSPDPDDRVHAAAAIYGDVDVLLTRNMKHLRTAPVLAAEVAVMTSDEFLVDLLQRHRDATIESFTRAATGRKSPPMTVHELADRITAAGAPIFVEHLRPFLGPR